ncbi:hypothetical protein B0H34DRAFT_671470 [Crassisporium funariophilum]|nr:hypothetical protein B0H34DRAFT_671470 [Crassisporium funariophilum]
MSATRIGFYVGVDALENIELIRLRALDLCRMSRQYFDSDLALENITLFTCSRRRNEEVEAGILLSYGLTSYLARGKHWNRAQPPSQLANQGLIWGSKDRKYLLRCLVSETRSSSSKMMMTKRYVHNECKEVIVLERGRQGLLSYEKGKKELCGSGWIRVAMVIPGVIDLAV